MDTRIKKLFSQLTFNRNIFDSLDPILEEILKLFNASTGSISLADHNEKTLIIYSARGIDKEKKIAAKLPFTIGITGAAVTSQKTIYVKDVNQDKRYVKLIDTVISELAIPILFEKQVIGVLNIESDQTNYFKKEDIQFAEKIAQELGKILGKNQNYLLALENYKEKDPILGYDAQIIFLKNRIRTVAPSDASILILGETGTGKELIAKSIHNLSNRKSQPFITLNCGALNENLLESEMFGHVKGAFTGAERNTIGRFEAADKGTLFLDELAEMPLSLQVKLLRVLQESEIERVGDYKKVKIDVRIISATHKDLAVEVEKGKFRLDLYFRLGVIPIRLPPLRERRGDIPLLAHEFLNEFNRRYGKKKFFDSEVIEILSKHTWSGNVRELENAVQYSAIISSDDHIHKEHLPENILTKQIDIFNKEPYNKKEDHFNEVNDLNLEKAILDLETKFISKALKQTKTQDEAAKLLGISRGSLQYKIKNNPNIQSF
jgi:transcriptional regulator with GAF, ATPase, and Fis domain